MTIKHSAETRGADVVILNQTAPNNKRIIRLLDNDFTFVKHGRTHWSYMHSYYDSDNYTFARHYVDLLPSRGRENISAFILPKDPNDNCLLHMGGYRSGICNRKFKRNR